MQAHALKRSPRRVVSCSHREISEYAGEALAEESEAVHVAYAAISEERPASEAGAAVEPYVHPNTLRYRIRRFEELSGLRFERVGDLVAAWWALQDGRITGADGPVAAP